MEANLVSPVVVIIVALTALGSLAIPNEEFASAFRLLKYAFLFLGGFLGIFGIVLGLYLTMAHLAGLLSFGVPYLVPFVERRTVRRKPVEGFCDSPSGSGNSGRCMPEMPRNAGFGQGHGAGKDKGYEICGE